MPAESPRLEEYRALRAANGQRAAARAIVLVASWIGWASLATVIVVVLPATLLLLVPLVLLAAAFEMNLEIVRGVEQVARYLRVAFEEHDHGAGWETASDDLAAHVPGAGAGDPLQFWTFIAALAANYLCVILCFGETAGSTARDRPEDTLDLALASVAHVAVLVRFAVARRGYRLAGPAVLERLRSLGIKT